MSPFQRTILAAVALTLPATAIAQSDAKQAVSVEVRVKSFSFTPSIIHLTAGTPVVLTLIDEKGGHNFSAPAFFAAANIAPEDRSKVTNGAVELTSGHTVTIRLVPSAGSFKLSCTHLMHGAFGMRGRIVVDS